MNFPPIPDPLTTQAAYEHICRCLAIQKVASMSRGVCAYRGDGGRRCAVGMLIPDDKYSEQMEVAPTNSIQLVMATAGVPVEIEGLLRLCQRAHDLSLTPGQIKVKLAEAAIDSGVTPGAEEAITEWE